MTLISAFVPLSKLDEKLQIHLLSSCTIVYQFLQYPELKTLLFLRNPGLSTTHFEMEIWVIVIEEVSFNHRVAALLAANEGLADKPCGMWIFQLAVKTGIIPADVDHIDTEQHGAVLGHLTHAASSVQTGGNRASGVFIRSNVQVCQLFDNLQDS